MSAEASPEQEGFSVEIVHMDGNAVLRLHGDLELATVLRLRVAVAAVHARGIRELGGVTYLSAPKAEIASVTRSSSGTGVGVPAT